MRPLRCGAPPRATGCSVPRTRLIICRCSSVTRRYRSAMWNTERDTNMTTGAFMLSSSGLARMAHTMHTVMETSVCRVFTCSWYTACSPAALNSSLLVHQQSTPGR